MKDFNQKAVCIVIEEEIDISLNISVKKLIISGLKRE
jgi:hypothetical protein